jgi:hypothetical protein
MHYLRLFRKGNFTKLQQHRRRQKGQPGSRSKTSKGYVRIYFPEHPNAMSDGQVLEHIMIMATHLNRPLTKDEEVHHRNGVKDDNQIDNLELRVGSHPAGLSIPDALQWAATIIKRYTPTLGDKDVL